MLRHRTHVVELAQVARPLIDFGRELYVPWQITRGKMLSRDIASLFGPLSPYINALWFRLFGVSLITLALANLAVLCLTVAGIYHLLRVCTIAPPPPPLA